MKTVKITVWDLKKIFYCIIIATTLAYLTTLSIEIFDSMSCLQPIWKGHLNTIVSPECVFVLILGVTMFILSLYWLFYITKCYKTYKVQGVEKK